jgi:hypothetical protein
MSKNRTFSLDEETIQKIEQDAKSLHLGNSAFLRFLIWSYDRKNNSSINQGG